MRNVLAKVAQADGEMVAAYIRTVFAQTSPDGVRTQLENVAATLAPKLPGVATMLREAREELTAFADFPHAHWRKSGRPNRSSGSTRSSSAAPTSSASSPTPTACSASLPAS
jgi:putative transposase